MTKTELVQLAANGKMMPDAPIIATRSTEIDAPLGNVWKILTDVSQWARWHPYLTNAVLSGPFAAGSQLTYGGFFKHCLEIAKVIDQELAMLCGTMAGYKGITRWDVSQTDSGKTRVVISECSSGFLIGTLYSNEKLGDHLQAWLDALKQEAERCV